jgi:cbb3-type cytochrome oxidase maturation protein
MSVITVLIIVSILVATGFLVAFLWSAGSGQYDDDISPAVRMLIEDAPIDNTDTKKHNPDLK